MRCFLAVAWTGVAAVLLHPLQSLVTVGCLVVILLPYLVGLGIARGLQQDAEAAVRCGASLYVTGQQFGRSVPVPLAVIPAVEHIEGVKAVVPRIVGRITLGKESEEAVLVGLPAERFPPSVRCVEGNLPRPGPRNELVLGTELARRLNLKVGDRIPPFYHNKHGDRLSEVVGIFRSDVSIWQAKLVFTSFETAAAIFDQEGWATDLLVDCLPACEAAVRSAILRNPVFSAAGGADRLHPRVVAREDLEALLPRGLLHREGVFNLHYLLAFAVGVPLVLVTSGFGLSERRREIGILKATGWQTDEILLRSLVETLILSVAGASIAVLMAFVWLKWLNGFGVAGLFLAGVDKAPGFQVPYRLTPLPACLAFLLALVMAMAGTLYSSWRAATVAPVEAMR